jgi:carboxyl-terminal processing protease
MLPAVLRASHAASFVAGIVLAGAAATLLPDAQAVPATEGDRYRTLDTFAQALSYVANNYVDSVEERKLLYDATRGMIGGLDPHSAFFPPRRYQRLRQDTEGEFGGVGLALGPGITDERDPRAQPWPFIDDVVPGSPADRAGIHIDDRVVAIDNEATAVNGKEVRDAGAWEQRLRGPSGTRVTLSIRRDGWSGPRTFSLVREQVKMPSVERLAVMPGIGYLAIRRFQEATTEDVIAALARLRTAGSLRVLILDLRGNPGGLLDQAIHVADLFLESGTIVTIRGRRGSIEEQVAHAPGTWSGFPMVCLVDQQSASAAEILAGALQDHRRAVMVGLPTYGKGSVQTFFDLEDGSGLKLTTARFYTPGGKSLEGTGITPDIVVDAFAAEEVVAGAPAARATPSVPASTAGAPETNDARIRERLTEDPQFTRALQEARRRLGPK